MTTSESYIQVAKDTTTGKQVRNLKWTYIDTDGSLKTRYIQVVAMVDADGLPVSFDTGVQDEILVELKRIRLGLALLTNNELKVEDAR